MQKKVLMIFPHLVLTLLTIWKEDTLPICRNMMHHNLSNQPGIMHKLLSDTLHPKKTLLSDVTFDLGGVMEPKDVWQFRCIGKRPMVVCPNLRSHIPYSWPNYHYFSFLIYILCTLKMLRIGTSSNPALYGVQNLLLQVQF